MDTSASNSWCTKCGHPVPRGAGFCPNCGTATASGVYARTELPRASQTVLPDAHAGATTLPTPPLEMPDTPTIGPTGVATSLDSPSPRPRVLASDGPFQIGQQVGPRYTILKLLGVGGMGAVYQAFDHELGVAVAIKVIRPAAQSDATAAKDLEVRFKRELVLARQVTHKYVVRIHDLGEIDGIKYLTMPFVEGETLATIIRKSGPLPLDAVIRISQQVAAGLAAAHEKGVVHRDLKPENIMIEKAADDPVAIGGDALIMDFGIARSVEQGNTQTAAGSVIGTLEYMAPEQAQGLKVDQRADQYALGLIIYDLLLGRARIANRENPMAELMARMSAPPPAPRTINAAIPESINGIVMRLLDPKPDNRYDSTQSLVAALERLTPDGAIRSDIHEVIIHDAPARSKLAMAAVLIILVGGAAGFFLSRGSTMTTVQAAQDPISVLIADFENKTGDAVFDGVVEQALTLGIEGASFVNAFPRRDALRSAAAIKPGAKLDEQTARLVALRENLGLVIVGAIEPIGSGYRITIKGVGPGNDGAVKYTLEDDAESKAAVLQTVGALAAQVRVALGDTVAPAANDAFTAANLEAASAYAQAQQLQAAGRRDDAIAKYQEAIALDKDFGRAYSGLAAQYESLGRPEEAEKYFQEALARIDRMNDRERYRTRAGYYMFSRKTDQAAVELTALLKAYPFDTTALANLALTSFYRRNLPQALEIGSKVSALQPGNVGRRQNLALYSMYAGQFEKAISESVETLKLNPSAIKAFVARALSELALGRPADAIKTYESLTKISADGASFALAGLADLAAVEGRPTDAIAWLDEGIAADEAGKNVTRAAAKRVVRGELRLQKGDAAGGLRDIQTGLAATTDQTVRSAAGLALARAGNRDAESIAATLERRLENDFQAYGKLIRAELLLSQRQPRQAVDLTIEAEKLANTWLGHVIRGRAYLQLEAFPDAYSQFEEAIKRQGEATAVFLDDVPSYRVFPQVHYYMGRAQEGIKSAAAAQSYKNFLSFVKSDEAAGGIIADARTRLAKLGS